MLITKFGVSKPLFGSIQCLNLSEFKLDRLLNYNLFLTCLSRWSSWRLCVRGGGRSQGSHPEGCPRTWHSPLPVNCFSVVLSRGHQGGILFLLCRRDTLSLKWFDDKSVFMNTLANYRRYIHISSPWLILELQVYMKCVYVCSKICINYKPFNQGLTNIIFIHPCFWV